MTVKFIFYSFPIGLFKVWDKGMYTLGNIAISLHIEFPRLSLNLDMDCHWLILGHVALTKIKCILIVISNVPRSGYVTARDQSMVEGGVTEGGKNTASFLFHE